MKLKILFVLFLVAALCSNIVRAQDDKAVSVKVTGSGKTPDEAKQAALRSAIEQAFGTFISAKTDILNDQVVSDQITSVSNGNIQKYEVLNESQLPGGGWATTLNATVSISKLTSFVQAKGISVEIKGGLFAINIKQQILNEQGEIRAIQDMPFLLNEIMLQSFDYSITSGEPQSLDSENKKWSIPLNVSARVNKNLDFVSEYLGKNLSAISLTEEEVANYESLNKPVYTVSLNKHRYSLRRKESMESLIYFASRWSYYVSSFAISKGKDYSSVSTATTKSESPDGYSDSDIWFYNQNRNFLSIRFPAIGSLVKTYAWKDALTLQDIEKISAYTVQPEFSLRVQAGRLSIGSYHAGGIVFFIDGSGKHGLVISPLDIGIGCAWGCQEESIPGTSDRIGSGLLNTKLIIEHCKESGFAAQLCADFTANGFSDWFLPSVKELQLVSTNLGAKEMGCKWQTGYGTVYTYWSSTEYLRHLAVCFDFEDPPHSYNVEKDETRPLVRPVRAF